MKVRSGLGWLGWLFLAACATDPGDDTPVFDVRGRVVDARSGAPLEKALVGVQTGITTTTGAFGEFVLRLHAGAYTFRAAAEGYQDVTLQYGVNGPAQLPDFKLTPGLGSLAKPPELQALDREEVFGGEILTLTGAHFGKTADSDNKVYLDDAFVLPVVSWSDNTIRVKLPLDVRAGTFDVTVGVFGRVSNALPLRLRPSLKTLSRTALKAGDELTLTGANFGDVRGDGVVTIGGQEAEISGWSGSSLLVRIPASVPAGSQAVLIKTGGQSSEPLRLTVLPTITGVSPLRARAGDRVVIEGAGFGAVQNSSRLLLGGVPIAPANWEQNTLSFIMPSDVVAGTLSVVVEVAGIASASASVTVLPTLRSATPVTVAVGDTIVLYGSNFGDVQGTSSVTIGGYAATVRTWSSTAITAVVPAGATKGNQAIAIFVGGQSTNALMVTILPNITVYAPVTGSGGTRVNLEGTNFGAVQGAGAVYLGPVALSVVSWTNTNISVMIPSDIAPGTYAMVAVAGGLTSRSVPFTVGPAIASVAPSAATVGSLVTITGTNFGTTSGTLTIGGVPAMVASWSATSIGAWLATTAEPGAQSVMVAVGSLVSNAYPITVRPTLTAASPIVVQAGDTLVLSGANFGASPGTVLAGTNSLVATSWTPTSIGLLIPASLPGGVYDLGIVAGGQTSNAIRLTVLPRVVSVSPPQATGGSTVVVSGAGFGSVQGASKVWVNGVEASPLAWSAVAVTLVVPANAPGGMGDITVSVGGQNQAAAFRVLHTITDLNPRVALAGMSVVLLGSNFGDSQGAGSVLVGSVPATVSAWSNTSIGVVVPSSAEAGVTNVSVIQGTLASAPVTLTVLPSITALSSTAAPAGRTIEITGANFGWLPGVVRFGSVPATISSWAMHQIHVAVPSGVSPGSAPVRVTVNGFDSAPANFTVLPGIAAVVPGEGSLGDQIEIDGVGFGTLSGSVTIGNVAASVLEWSPSRVTVTVPAVGAGSHDLVVTAGGVPSESYPFFVNPRVTALSQNFVSGGDTLTVNGANFGVVPGTVSIAGVGVSVSVWGEDAITVLAPATVTGGTRSLVVVAGDRTSQPVTLTVVPQIDVVDPDSGGVNAQIELVGRNFGSAPMTAEVFVGGVPAPVAAWSATSVTVRIPAGLAAGLHGVVLRVDGASSTPAAFTVVPGIDALSVSAGTGGDALRISGTNFGAVQNGDVYVAGVTAQVLSWSDSSIDILVPSAAPAGVQIVAVFVGGSWSNAVPFTVLPNLQTISPGSASGGAVLTASGSNFGPPGNGTIEIGGVPAGVIGWSNTAITAVVPDTVTAGSQPVIVRSGVATSQTRVLDVQPVLDALTPNEAAVGAVLSLTGRNLGATPGVLYVGNVVATVTAWSHTAISARVPALAAGNHAVTASVGGRVSAGLSLTVVPGITSVTPDQGYAGTTIVIQGTSFGTTPSVMLGATSLTVLSATDTRIDATLPTAADPGIGALTVTANGFTSTPRSFAVVPNVTALSPASGTSNTLVTLTGNHFGSVPGEVRFGGILAAIEAWSSTSIQARVPAAAMPGRLEVVVMAAGLSSAPRAFDHGRVWIDRRYPAFGAPGEAVSLTGRFFGSTVGTANIAGVAASVDGWTDTAVQIRVPSGTPKGTQAIRLTSASGVTSNAIAFVVRGNDVWLPMDESPLAVRGHTAVWNGVEMIVFGGRRGSYALDRGARYNPATDSWLPLSMVGAPSARWGHTAVWTGNEIIVWGGTNGTSKLNTGAAYNPVSDSWRSLSLGGAVPTARSGHTAIWTGSRMVVWGGEGASGRFNTGGRYDPVSNVWLSVSTTGAPLARGDHGAVWTGREMIVWGGRSGGDGTELSDGGRYDPASDQWLTVPTVGAPSPRAFHSVVWTGSELIVWGGRACTPVCAPLGNGARYNPNTSAWNPVAGSGAPAARWNHVAVWTGARMVVWGGEGASGRLNTGGRYDPVANAWLATSVAGNVPAARSEHTAVWTGSEIIVWGGSSVLGELASGGRYNPGTDVWLPTAESVIRAAYRTGHTVVWTGSEMIIWGGLVDGVVSNTGFRYRPADDTWVPVATSSLALPRTAHTAVWTGSAMAIWGGTDGTTRYANGALYLPSSNSWLALSTNNEPSPRSGHTAVWTGTDMIIWGGDDGSLTNTGARWNQSGDVWTPLPTLSAPTARKGHTAVWADSTMVVWGGQTTSNYTNSGGRYDPATNAWSAVNTSGAPAPRSEHTAVWSGTHVIVWGGRGASGLLNNGGRYSVSANLWTTADNGSNPLLARSGHVAAWLGNQMFVWGGQGTTGPLVDAGLYNPATNIWVRLGDAYASPIGGLGYTAVWTGTEAIVWGLGGLRYLP